MLETMQEAMPGSMPDAKRSPSAPTVGNRLFGSTARLVVSSRGISIFAALTVGAVLLFGAAFAQPEIIHEATHDVRHAAGFPCH